MGLETRPIPPKFHSLVSHVLQPGEHVVWWGQPSALLRGHFALFTLVFIAVFYGVVLIALARDSDDPAFALSMLVAVVAILFELVFGPLLGWLAFNWSHCGRSLYLLTNARAIHFRPNWNGDYTILETWPEDLGGLAPTGTDPFHQTAAFKWLWRGDVVWKTVEDTLRPGLVGRLKHNDNAVRRRAILTSVALVRSGKLPLTVLVEAFHSEDCFIRAHAASALGKLGGRADLTLPDLRRIVFDENHGVSQAALRSIEAISKAA